MTETPSPMSEAQSILTRAEADLATERGNLEEARQREQSIADAIKSAPDQSTAAKLARERAEAVAWREAMETRVSDREDKQRRALEAVRVLEREELAAERTRLADEIVTADAAIAALVEQFHDSYRSACQNALDLRSRHLTVTHRAGINAPEIPMTWPLVRVTEQMSARTWQQLPAVLDAVRAARMQREAREAREQQHRESAPVVPQSEPVPPAEQPEGLTPEQVEHANELKRRYAARQRERAEQEAEADRHNPWRRK